MKEYKQITFRDLQEEQQEILIARLGEAGYEGFEELGFELRAYIPEEKFNRTLLHEILYKYQHTCQEELLPAQNWNHVWESEFPPVLVDDFAGVRASFHAPLQEVQYEIIITPKMSFGTGHHASTGMMIRQMREIDFRGKSVLDFGTGTGILAILAEKMGAAAVLALDIDDWSIKNAIENCEVNHCQQIRIELCGHAATGGRYDVILANITKNVILENIAPLSLQLKNGGVLLLSGLLSIDEEDLTQALITQGLTAGKKIVENNWICIRFNR